MTKDEKKEYDRTRYLKNRAATMERVRKWILKNKKKHREYCKKWERINHERAVEIHKMMQDRRCFGGLRKKVLSRDGYKCTECGLTNEEVLKSTGQSLPVHHINGNNKDHQMENLITVCRGCHSALHKKMRNAS